MATSGRMRKYESWCSLCPRRLLGLGLFAGFLEICAKRLAGGNSVTPRGLVFAAGRGRVGLSTTLGMAARCLRNPRILLTFLATALLLSINWLTYIWAVNTGHVVESSLGYFINPLVNVVFGVLFLGERMRAGQWVAVGLAALGVIYLTLSLGALPWIGLTLAFSFAGYGLLRKTAQLNSLEGLALETLFLFVPALLYLFYLARTGAAVFGQQPSITVLLMLSGLFTAIPLLLFAAGARRISFSLVGILQYTGPTIQLLLGIFLYGEAFSLTKLIGFGLIWLALALYSGESYIQWRRTVNSAAAVA